MTPSAIAEFYMIMGGIPFYLDYLRKGESPAVAIDRICFSELGPLRNEYQNLYKALFDYPENHEAIVKALATARTGLTREEILKKSKIAAGGPYTRAMNDLLLSGFIREEAPFGRKKRGSIYRLIDEYSVFYHRFIKPNRTAKKGLWSIIAASQKYKIWTGYAFETLCQKHIQEIKKALGIAQVYTETSSFRFAGTESQKGFQIDLILNRNDRSINLCACKFYDAPFTIDRKVGNRLLVRKRLFKQTVKTRKQLFTTMITNFGLKQNEYSREAVDSYLTVKDLM